MTANGAILVTKDLHKAYQIGTSEVQVLKGIDLEIKEGQIVAIVGPSGVGKSTLLHILGTLDRPSGGRVEIDRTNVFAFDNKKLAQFRNRTIGFVFQFHHLLPEFTALENVMMPSLIAGYPKTKTAERATHLLNEVGLGQRLNHRPNELSGGELQRVAVARALMNEPKLVLADEPSGNLDQTTSEALHELLWQLSRRYKKTFVIVTHNRELADNADKIVELSDGRVKSEQLRQIV
ncbi:ABC transporter ATP-binding protein [candidate division KSB1 bacterium]|nr:ABC transporter ATP-binding protein [candidate division KSB1 bacterium]NIR69573.1 ABC transporter ATP-binding protein [candidate division KSB1 bacterium]NIS25921.1 ABC transporter ATP-binding protein [candidate division KSB1 bacterium]NIT72802.1 ABC transporter ATP-binding protein [candidate division KSB1 bacterium]NIU26609.1 ABC transporter ATP-binding protein [candidate division KSB1 bacterium]